MGSDQSHSRIAHVIAHLRHPCSFERSLSAKWNMDTGRVASVCGSLYFAARTKGKAVVTRHDACRVFAGAIAGRVDA
eukprot:3741834-Prymnesium_polylepis.1